MSISVELNNVCYGKRVALREVNFELPSGSFTAVLGRNGSGKSTLAGALLSLLKYDGVVAFGGRNASLLSHRERAKTVSGVLQMPRAPHITVYELVCLGRCSRLDSFERFGDKDRVEVEKALSAASLAGLKEAYLDEISGGELKRAYFAMALAQGAEYLVLDEVTSSMDSDYESAFLTLARELADGGKTVVAVMHNLEAAVRYADRILLLDGGRQLFFGTTSQMLETELIEKTFNVSRETVNGRVFFASR